MDSLEKKIIEIETTIEKKKDEFLEFILGSEHRFSPRACTIDPYQDFKSSYTPFESNSSVKIGFFNFIKGVLFYNFCLLFHSSTTSIIFENPL